MKTKQVIGMIAVLAIIGAYFGAMIGGLFGAPTEGSLIGSFVAELPVLGTSVNIGNTIKALREQMADKETEMRSLIETSEAESRDFNDEEKTTYDKLEADARALDTRIKRLEKLEKGSAGQAQQQREVEDVTDQEKREQEVEAAFRSYLQKGFGKLTQEQRDMMEERAMSTGTGSEGGYLIPEGFVNKLIEALKSYGGVRGVAEVMTTATGNRIPWPTANDSGEEGELIDENTAANEDDVAFGSIPVGAYTYSSKMVPVPNQLLQDSAIDLEGYLARVLTKRIWKITERHFCVGTGTNQPKGFLTAATKGADAVVDGLAYDNMVDLKFSVDEAYRKNAVWMFNDETLKILMKMKDADNKPLWAESIRAGEPDTILGKPYIINNYMPTIGASNKSVAFGDFKTYLIRDVQGAYVMRLAERFAEKNQTAFIMFSRHDGTLLDAGTHPIKYLQHAAS